MFFLRCRSRAPSHALPRGGGSRWPFRRLVSETGMRAEVGKKLFPNPSCLPAPPYLFFPFKTIKCRSFQRRVRHLFFCARFLSDKNCRECDNF